MALDLVPIRLHLQAEGRVVQDSFCWNAQASEQEVQQFAAQFCREQQLADRCIAQVVKAITGQVAAYTTAAATAHSTAGERLELIKLDMHLGDTLLQDQFVWDVHNRDADPEAFATCLCRDLGLQAAFATLIAVEIREQVLKHLKTAAKTGSIGPVSPEKVPRRSTKAKRSHAAKGGQPAVASVMVSGVVRKRDEQEAYTPVVRTLTASELRERELRAVKGQKLKAKVKVDKGLERSSSPALALQSDTPGLPSASARLSQQLAQQQSYSLQRNPLGSGYGAEQAQLLQQPAYSSNQQPSSGQMDVRYQVRPNDMGQGNGWLLPTGSNGMSFPLQNGMAWEQQPRYQQMQQKQQQPQPLQQQEASMMHRHAYARQMSQPAQVPNHSQQYMAHMRQPGQQASSADMWPGLQSHLLPTRLASPAAGQHPSHGAPAMPANTGMQGPLPGAAGSLPMGSSGSMGQLHGGHSGHSGQQGQSPPPKFMQHEQGGTGRVLPPMNGLQGIGFGNGFLSMQQPPHQWQQPGAPDAAQPMSPFAAKLPPQDAYGMQQQGACVQTGAGLGAAQQVQQPQQQQRTHVVQSFQRYP